MRGVKGGADHRTVTAGAASSGSVAAGATGNLDREGPDTRRHRPLEWRAARIAFEADGLRTSASVDRRRSQALNGDDDPGGGDGRPSDATGRPGVMTVAAHEPTEPQSAGRPHRAIARFRIKATTCGYPRDMTASELPPQDDATLEDDDTLPSEHPAGADAPISAGEVLSGEGVGTGRSGASPGASGEEPERRDPGEA